MILVSSVDVVVDLALAVPLAAPLKYADLYFINLRDSAQLSPAQTQQLHQLLAQGELQQFDGRLGVVGVVVPRAGLISGWSEKATEILHLAQLDTVERVEKGKVYWFDHSAELSGKTAAAWLSEQIDPMLEEICESPQAAYQWIFGGGDSAELQDQTNTAVDWLQLDTLVHELSADDYRQLRLCQQRVPAQVSDVEWAMFQEVNSEHCRHHVFQAVWQWRHDMHQHYSTNSLMQHIRATTNNSPSAVLSAYRDNSAVLRGHEVMEFQITAADTYELKPQLSDLVLKVETHNHPTGVCPYPGAATGVGGEIRDEVATGRGAYSLAGVCGFMVSDLCLADHVMIWERPHVKFYQQTSSHLASAARIMLEAPLGAARYGNEYGRPLVGGFFRTLLQQESPNSQPSNSQQLNQPVARYRGFHKPLMICGGMGIIARQQIEKYQLKPGDFIVVLGGFGMKIGLGGGSLSSTSSLSEQSSLSGDVGLRIGGDFASVQRENPQMQRRAYQVIEACFRRADNPIISIHDVGAGGLANAVPELVHDAGLGARIELRDIPVADHTMSPREIWCNESQERYVLGLAPQHLEFLSRCATKERAPFAVIGVVTTGQRLRVYDRSTDTDVVDVDLTALLAKNTRRIVVDTPYRPSVLTAQYDADNPQQPAALRGDSDWLRTALHQVLQVPCVGDKSFLITIADRWVGGRTVLEPMVGPWQVPVADAGVMLASYMGLSGQVIAMGEKPQVALVNPAAASRLAAAEAIMNVLCADVASLTDISFSANWQVDFALVTDRAGVYEAVQALSEFCCQLGIAVPVGKDSMAMKAQVDMSSESKATQHGSRRAGVEVSAPITLVVTAAAPVQDVTQTLTPVLDMRPSQLLWVNLGDQMPTLGCSAFALSCSALTAEISDVSAQRLKEFFTIFSRYKRRGWVYAYHDISDGGLVVAAVEMAFATGCSLELWFDKSSYSMQQRLFGEGVGALIQVAYDVAAELGAELDQQGIQHEIISSPSSGLSCRVADNPEFALNYVGEEIFRESLLELKQSWSELSYQLRRRRDDPACVEQERALMAAPLGRLFFESPQPFNHPDLADTSSHESGSSSRIALASRPTVVILREQGVNGHMEMAYSFYDAGFEVKDLHMSEWIQGDQDMSSVTGLAAVGGFSYGDVLDAGRGWAMVIQHNPRLREACQAFLQNPATFALGVCNGCQMLAYLREWIDGGEHWPQFQQNSSKQFEGRTVMVEVESSPSMMWQAMEGMKLPVVVAHGEGRASYQNVISDHHEHQQLVGLRYIPVKTHDDDNQVSGVSKQEQPIAYPLNPNGSSWNVAGITSADGRVNLMMPHPERNILSCTLSWQDPSWGKYTPWRLMFTGARRWVDQTHS